MASVPHFPEIVARIQWMHASGLVELRWLTSWPKHWVEPWQRVGLGPFAYNAVRYSTRRFWKALVVKEWLDEHPTGRCIWTDDDMTPAGDYAATATDSSRYGRTPQSV